MGHRILNLLIWLLPGGSLIQGFRAVLAYRECKRAAESSGLGYDFKWDVLNGPRWRLLHPAHDRYCHICGADAFQSEPCDAGLHS